VALEGTAIRDPEGLNNAVVSLQQAFRLGGRGVVCDYSLLMNSWGFNLEDILININLWHGEVDITVPPSMGRYLSNTIPNCQASFLAGEEHYLFANHAEDILKDSIHLNNPAKDIS
jgi:hypothetical protein